MAESNPTAGRSIGVIGGSFDPVHVGHLILAQDAKERLELSEVIFVPAAIPPHKQHLQQASSEHRLNMLSFALEADVCFSVSDLEVQRGGVSYTVDTIRELKDECPDAEIVLLMGGDTLIDLHNWYKVDELLDLCQVATVLRPGEDSVGKMAEQIGFTGSRKEDLLARVIESRLVEISSTEIRMRVAEGLSIRYLVPPEVEMYIYEHGLYKG